ncbi:MAG TPA: hypothetical protein VNT55_01295 [Baekduia sp.]|nr:hypothetical protein [Baekduia sp.]
MFRDPLSVLTRDAQAAPVAMTAPSFAPRPDVPIWPSGLARFDDGILEITSGDGLRVAARDIVAIGLAPALGARMLLTLDYRSGFDTINRRYWVALTDHDHLQRLVATVRGALVARAA